MRFAFDSGQAVRFPALGRAPDHRPASGRARTRATRPRPRYTAAATGVLEDSDAVAARPPGLPRPPTTIGAAIATEE
jgi:hypothetical protein